MSSTKKSISVEVRLMATGDAPIMKQKNYKVDQEKKVEWIIAFIRKYLKLEDPESLVNYKPVSINEISTLVDKLINFTKAEPLFGT